LAAVTQASANDRITEVRIVTAPVFNHERQVVSFL